MLIGRRSAPALPRILRQQIAAGAARQPYLQQKLIAHFYRGCCPNPNWERRHPAGVLNQPCSITLMYSIPMLLE